MRYLIFILSLLRSLHAYPGFILGIVKREFQSKHRTSTLGAAWSVINPLALIVVYMVIFFSNHARPFAWGLNPPLVTAYFFALES